MSKSIPVDSTLTKFKHLSLTESTTQTMIAACKVEESEDTSTILSSVSTTLTSVEPVLTEEIVGRFFESHDFLRELDKLPEKERNDLLVSLR